jgi:release factor glutamine methyltransferase
MTIRTAYHKTKSELDALYASGEAQAIVDLLFFELLHISRSDLIKNPDEILTDNLMLMLEEKTNELLQYKPIQQVIGKAQFLGFDFIVDSSVLIPRPETEELVLLVEESIANIVEASILDIGSGSGCIPISLHKRNPNTKVQSIDVSVDALKVANLNNQNIGSSVNFLLQDFLNELEWESLGLFDVIVSNPPYIPFEEKQLLDKNVTMYEPSLALFVPDNNPLLFYEKISAFALKHLKKDGVVLMETHENFATDVSQLFESNGFVSAVILDVFNKKRFVRANRCH